MISRSASVRFEAKWGKNRYWCGLTREDILVRLKHASKMPLIVAVNLVVMLHAVSCSCRFN
eukprot:5258921-Amphidinium_carterae.1